MNYSKNIYKTSTYLFAWGINLNYINRGYLQYLVYPPDLVDFSPNSLNQWSGHKWSLDGGLLLKTKYFITGMGIKNFLASPWFYSNGIIDSIIDSKPNINLSFNIPNKILSLGIFYDDMTNTTKLPYQRHIHIGATLFPHSHISFFTGINDGYLSWGTKLRIKFIELIYYSVREEYSDFMYLESSRIHGLQFEFVDIQH